MKERPIIFSGPMVRAILEGRKTQTRRVARSHPLIDAGSSDEYIKLSENDVAGDCPYGRPGDRLWVRETARLRAVGHQWFDLHYRATDDLIEYKQQDRTPYRFQAGRWTPSIFMPRWASRITLKITGVRAQRLQEITVADALAEGVVPADPSSSFRAEWDAINGKKAPWESNPWVWVIEFSRLEAR